MKTIFLILSLFSIITLNSCDSKEAPKQNKEVNEKITHNYDYILGSWIVKDLNYFGENMTFTDSTNAENSIGALIGVEYLFDDDSTFNLNFLGNIIEGNYEMSPEGVKTIVDDSPTMNKVIKHDQKSMTWETANGNINYIIEFTRL